MKVYLMHRGQDFDLEQPAPWNQAALVQDLELTPLLRAMSGEDPFLLKVATKAVLASLTEVDAIVYRQRVLQDCLKNTAVVREVYRIAVEAIETEKKTYFGFFGKYPDALLHRSLEVLQVFLETLRRLKEIAREHGEQFDSEGFQAFFARLEEEVNEVFFARAQTHLSELAFRHGVLISAKLGPGNKGTDYRLSKPTQPEPSWLQRLSGKQQRTLSFQIADRDESGAKALGELRNRGINRVAGALANSSDHMLGFFIMLRTELAFYLGCLNLHQQLTAKGYPICMPQPRACGAAHLSADGLYDPVLALTVDHEVVGNQVHGAEKPLVIITGANQGGKSTFLRSVGLSQLMMQCGMFVAAQEYSSSLCDGLLTHFKREEDSSMQSGKLDEEMGRMSDIIDHLHSYPMILFNESFAATNEREGSEIAYQVVRALLDHRPVKVVFVTHLYEFAHRFYASGTPEALFLRADRRADGTRTFKIEEGEPLQTSYGKDVYDKVFGARAAAEGRSQDSP